MTLITQAFSRKNLDPLNFELGTFVQNGKAPPRPVFPIVGGIVDCWFGL